jgi:predicted PurR-regulated permease PerM
MYRQVSLHPVVVLVALAVGGAVAGIIGAIVAVPLTAAMTAAAGAMRMDDGGTGSDVLDDATPS